MNASRDKPEPPEAPDPSDCCGGGCARCVFDVYDEQLAEWRETCARIDAETTPDTPARPPPSGD
ncbi:MAG TPA: oxidoreductase-like domain-containing protein [Xanthomonadales bacterium]|nr:oxidoreductase-like domain-containing protein [Xanthomonadales bacterium]